MAGRRYSDDEMVNLHVLLRFYCGSFGISFKEFCSDLSKEIGGDADHQEQIHDAISNFLNKGTMRAVERLMPQLVPVLEKIFEQAGDQGHDEARSLLGALVNGELDIDPEAKAFFEPTRRTEYMAGSLQARLEQKDPKLGILRTIDRNYDKTISQALGLFAYMVEDEGSEAHKVRDDRLINRHFVAIRRWSNEPGGYSVHGLKFWEHETRKKFMYFSEKYRILANDDRADDRESNGVCFFDSRYLTALARGRMTQMMTMLSGVIPQADTFDSFRGILTTSNREGDRMSAHVLCLACADAEEKHRRMGHFKLPELLEVSPETQHDLIKWWVEEDGSREPTLFRT